MKHWHILVLVFASVICSCGNKKQQDLTFSDYLSSVDTSQYIKTLNKSLDQLNDSLGLFGSVYLNNPDSLLVFFSKRENTLKWWKKYTVNFVRNYTNWNKTLDENGLDSNYYHAETILNCYRGILDALSHQRVPSTDTFALMEILLADGIYASGENINYGRISPKYALTPNVVQMPIKRSKFSSILNSKLYANLYKKVPNFKEYKGLRIHMQRMKMVPSSAFIRDKKHNVYPKDSLAKVDLLARLVALGAISNVDSLFIFASRKSINRGLLNLNSMLKSNNRMLNASSINALDFNPKEREQKIGLNLERWRWTGPLNKGHRVYVNIARNELDAYRNDTLVLTMRVCTGKARHKNYFDKFEKYLNRDSNAYLPKNQETPILKSDLSHLFVMPNWNIPKSILFNELLGKIRRNPGYIHRLGYRLQTYGGKDVNPYSIDWYAIKSNRMKVHLVQPGGNRNALGKLKVIFKNSFSVYCHDTPQTWAFKQKNRHVSHGCIRMQQPFDFAEYLSSCQDSSRLDYMYMAAGMDPKRDTSLFRLRKEELADTNIIKKKYGVLYNERFNLETKIPIYILYFTCEVNENGMLNIISDGYRRDELILEALKRPRHTWDKRKRVKKS